MKTTLLLSLFVSSMACAQWDWDSRHIDQKKQLDEAIETLSKAYDGYSLLTNPEYITAAPFDAKKVMKAYQFIVAASEDEIEVTLEQNYLETVNTIKNKIDKRHDRIQYHIGQALIKAIKQGDPQAIKTGTHIIQWKFLQLPTMLEVKDDQRFLNIQALLEQAL